MLGINLTCTFFFLSYLLLQNIGMSNYGGVEEVHFEGFPHMLLEEGVIETIFTLQHCV